MRREYRKARHVPAETQPAQTDFAFTEEEVRTALANYARHCGESVLNGTRRVFMGRNPQGQLITTLRIIHESPGA